MNHTTLYIALVIIILSSCGQIKQEQKSDSKASPEVTQNQSILHKVDVLDRQVKEVSAAYTLIASLDHHRMAKEEGVYTPPAIASIFSDAKINTELLANNDQLLGLDLPFKEMPIDTHMTMAGKKSD